jgi:hypothetical protein
MLRLVRTKTGFIAFVAIFVIGTSVCVAQERVTRETMRKLLNERTEFSETDFAALDKGKALTKVLKADDKREVAVLGVIAIPASVEVVEKAFRNTITLQQKKTSEGFGGFSDPPVAKDFLRLRPDAKEIRNLRDCRIGDCGLRLSASQIESFEKEVDWDADDAEARALDLYRSNLLDYLVSYLERGDAALIKYENKEKPVSLLEEQRSLKKKLLWSRAITPKFYDFLDTFPKTHPNVTNSFSWSKVKFGLKPVIILSHTITFNNAPKEGKPQVFILSKQIYASRYIDSSLGLTAIIGAPEKSDNPETFLLITNHTRASALGSKLAGLARRIVKSEATAKLKAVLENTRRSSRHALTGDPELADTIAEESFLIRLFRDNYLFWILIVCIPIMLLVILRKPFSKK